MTAHPTQLLAGLWPPLGREDEGGTRRAESRLWSRGWGGTVVDVVMRTLPATTVLDARSCDGIDSTAEAFFPTTKLMP
jgi:hypothetical protein